MNLTQQKLTKSEWDFLELPVNKKELYILKFIHNSYNDISASENPNNSLIGYLKINVYDYEDFHKYFYNKFYEYFNHKPTTWSQDLAFGTIDLADPTT